jgi:hypothetical protein
LIEAIEEFVEQKKSRVSSIIHNFFPKLSANVRSEARENFETLSCYHVNFDEHIELFDTHMSQFDSNVIVNEEKTFSRERKIVFRIDFFLSHIEKTRETNEVVASLQSRFRLMNCLSV